MPNARALAAERQYRNRHSSTHAGILGDPTRIDEDGIAGELAFAREFQIDSASVTAEAPVPYNFLLADGTRVDVRTSRAAGYLMVPERKFEQAQIDVYVLAKYDEVTNKARLIGWATKSDIASAPCYVLSKLPGATKCFNQPARALRDIEDLKRRHTLTLQPSLF